MRDRSAFLYMEASSDSRAFAQCGTCANFNRAAGRCRWFSGNDEVGADDSCGLYVEGAPDKSIKPTGRITPAEAGFYDGKVRCENCNAFDARDRKRPHCDFYVQLNRMLPRLFKLDELVKPRACCNAFAPGARDPKQFGPYGPVPDSDDRNSGGLIDKLRRRGVVSNAQIKRFEARK